MTEEEEEYFKITNEDLSSGDEKKLNELYLSDYERLKKKFAKAK